MDNTVPPINNIGYLIDNVEHLKQIIMIYGKKVFKSKDVHDDVLNFIVKNFVEKPFPYNGRVLGNIKDENLAAFNLTANELAARIRQRAALLEFWNLFILNFTVTYVKDPTIF